MSLAGILATKGAAVVFSKTTPGTYNETTDTTTAPVTVSVAGHAMQIDGDPELYKNLELIESENPTLLFKPDTVGQMPALGSTVLWGAQTFTVRNINKLAMDGTPTAARIVVSGS
jgi:hypothetical protein